MRWCSGRGGRRFQYARCALDRGQLLHARNVFRKTFTILYSVLAGATVITVIEVMTPQVFVIGNVVVGTFVWYRFIVQVNILLVDFEIVCAKFKLHNLGDSKSIYWYVLFLCPNSKMWISMNITLKRLQNWADVIIYFIHLTFILIICESEKYIRCMYTEIALQLSDQQIKLIITVQLNGKA